MIAVIHTPDEIVRENILHNPYKYENILLIKNYINNSLLNTYHQ